MASCRAGSPRCRPTCSTTAGARPSCCSAASASPSRSTARRMRQERLIPFDVLPRILVGRRMGHAARAASSSASRRSTPTSSDVYGRREILRAGIVPEDLVFQNPVFRPEMNGQKVPHDIYVHIAGIDIVRVDAETFYVLEDNARTPSGVSYMLENREIMLRLFPELFARHRVAPVENYPDELLATLNSVAPATASAEPTVVLLTPGVYNSAYYEHSFLADKLGVELVEGRDLFVKDDVVYMRTTAGAQARRRDLPPHRRRFPRSARLPARFRARRARPDVGLPGRQRHARQRGRHRHRRRQGGLQLHAGDREILSRRGADPEERADLALPRGGPSRLCARSSRGTGGQGGARLRRLRHADRAEGRQGDDRGVPRQAQDRTRRTSSRSRRSRSRPARPASRRASRRATSICARSCSPGATASASCRAA